MGRNSTKSLAPGFRFHPTDEELVRYYLKRKVSGKSFRFDAITQYDVYKSEPWDLPGKSKMHSRDQEWYFFSALDKKYGNGSRTNRATDQGYWKTTGKDRPVHHNSRIVGMKKTLVFHEGRAPRGARSNWVMHEYRLVDEELEKAGVIQDAFVPCRIFQKSGTGPKNGEQYGAPFIEEEWDDDELIMVPGEQVAEQGEPKAEICDESYVGDDDIEQNLDISIAPEEEPILLEVDDVNQSNYCAYSEDLFVDDNKPFIGDHEYSNDLELPDSHKHVDSILEVNDVDQSNYCAYSGDLYVDDNKPFIGGREYSNDLELPGDQEHVDSLENNFVDSRLESNDYHVDGTNSVSFPELDFLLDEPYFDATSDPLFGNGFFLNEMEPLNFDMDEDYLSFFNGEDNNTGFYSSDVIASEEPFLKQEVTNPPTAFTENEGTKQLVMTDEHCLNPSGNDGSYSEVIASEEPLLNQEVTNAPLVFTENEGTNQLVTTNKHSLDPSGNDGSSSSNQNSDSKNPFEKYSANMLASIPTPNAFASEFPSKDVIMRLTSAAPASVTHVTAGMIQIANMDAVEWSYPKHGIVDLTFSFTLPQQGHISSFLSGKTPIPSILSRGWMIYLMFFWVLALSTSYKIGTCLYTH